MVKKLVKGYCHKKFSSELISYNAITEIGICQLPLSYLTVMPQTAIFQYVLNFFQKKKIPLLNFFFAFRYIFFLISQSVNAISQAYQKGNISRTID